MEVPPISDSLTATEVVSPVSYGSTTAVESSSQFSSPPPLNLILPSAVLSLFQPFLFLAEMRTRKLSPRSKLKGELVRLDLET